MSDITLINPPHSFVAAHKMGKGRQKEEWINYPPLGLAYLAAVLKQQGFSADIVDAPALGYSVNNTVRSVVASDPKVIGITATTPQLRAAFLTAQELKKIIPDVPVILGGSHVTVDTTIVERYDCFDYGFIGEGEVVFPAILKTILNGGRPLKIIHGFPPNNLDTLPYPARHLLPNHAYYFPLHGKKFTSLLTSRGCPFHCYFCCISAIGGRRVRYRSPQNVVTELKTCVNSFNIEWFQFVDNNFPYPSKERTLALCKAIAKAQLGIEYGTQSRIDLVDQEILEALYSSGCREISFGIESGSFHIRRFIGKPFDDLQIKNVLKACQKTGISTVGFFMFGFPLETIEDLELTLHAVTKLGVDYMEAHITTVMPGSDLFNDAVQKGLIPADIWYNYAIGDVQALPAYIPNGLTKDFLLQCQRKAYQCFYLHRPSYWFHILQKTKSWRDLLRYMKVARILLKEFG